MVVIGNRLDNAIGHAPKPQQVGADLSVADPEELLFDPMSRTGHPSSRIMDPSELFGDVRQQNQLAHVMQQRSQEGML